MKYRVVKDRIIFPDGKENVLYYPEESYWFFERKWRRFQYLAAVDCYADRTFTTLEDAEKILTL